MAAPGRVMRAPRLTPGESYQRHIQRKKVIALIAGLLLLPVSLLMIAAYDRGPLGRQVSDVLGISIPVGDRPTLTPTAASVAQGPTATPTPVACRDTTINGLVSDAETGALLNGVKVTASFGAAAETSPDGEYNIPICYDPVIHDGFSLVFERDGYESASLDLEIADFPGVVYQAPDVGLYSIQTPTPCLDTTFIGSVVDGDTGAPLNGVKVSASFGATAETSSDGEYKFLVCYDPKVHDGFSLVFEKDGYESGSLDVATNAYPGLSYPLSDVQLYSILTPTPEPTLLGPPRQTPLPTETPTLFQPPRQTPLPTATPTLFQPPRQTPRPTTDTSVITVTAVVTTAAGDPTPTDSPPKTLPETGVFDVAFPGQAIGFVLLAMSLMLIAAGVWPQSERRGR